MLFRGGSFQVGPCLPRDLCYRVVLSWIGISGDFSRVGGDFSKKPCAPNNQR